MDNQTVRDAYRLIQPDQEARDRMLRAILEEQQKALSPAPKKRRRWLFPVVGAAAVLVCALALPQTVPDEAPLPEDGPPVTAIPRPEGLVGSLPPVGDSPSVPDRLSWEDGLYVWSPETAASEEDLGPLLEERPEGRLHALQQQEGLALVTPRGIRVYLPISNP